MKRSLAVLALAVVAAAPLRAEELKGAAILAHPIGKTLMEFTTLAKAGKLDEAGKLQSKAAQKKRADLTPADRKDSDAFVKDFMPAPGALTDSLSKGGTLAIDGDKATLNITIGESTKNADGSVTASSTAMAFAFAREGGDWRLDQ